MDAEKEPAHWRSCVERLSDASHSTDRPEDESSIFSFPLAVTNAVPALLSKCIPVAFALARALLLLLLLLFEWFTLPWEGDAGAMPSRARRSPLERLGRALANPELRGATLAPVLLGCVIGRGCAGGCVFERVRDANSAF